jgi:hypothetical protein
MSDDNRLPKPKPGETYIEQTPNPKMRFVEFAVSVWIDDDDTPMPPIRVSLGTKKGEMVRLTVLDTTSRQITRQVGAWDRPPHPLMGMIAETWDEANREQR